MGTDVYRTEVPEASDHFRSSDGLCSYGLGRAAEAGWKGSGMGRCLVVWVFG